MVGGAPEETEFIRLFVAEPLVLFGEHIDVSVCPISASCFAWEHILIMWHDLRNILHTHMAAVDLVVSFVCLFLLRFNLAC